MILLFIDQDALRFRGNWDPKALGRKNTEATQFLSRKNVFISHQQSKVFQADFVPEVAICRTRPS